MSGLYYRHKMQGHIVRADGPQPKGQDAFAGTVVWSPDDPEAPEPGTFSSCWMRAAFDRTTIRNVKPDVEYVRHIRTGYVARVTGAGYEGRPHLFAGIVVEGGTTIEKGYTSDIFSRAEFEACTYAEITAAPAPDIDTVESMQLELEMMRIALGVDAEPLDTLPERMLRAAASYRKLYDAVKAWESEA